MANPEIANVTVNILKREFKIKCPQDRISELQDAASYLDNKMQELHRSDKAAMDYIAITAALNITHELITKKNQTSDFKNRILSLENRLDQTLANYVSPTIP